MAGLKKTKKDGSSPNLVLVVFLIFFVLVSIGLGVFAYYGVDNLEKMKSAEKASRAQVEIFKQERNKWEYALREATAPIGITPLTPDERNFFDAQYKSAIANPDQFKEVSGPIREIRKKSTDLLGPWSEAELKYPTTYSEKVKAATDEATESKSKLAALKTEYDEFKKNYDKIVAKYDADIAKVQEDIAKGNADALAASKVTNDKFPALEKVLATERADKERERKEHDAEKTSLTDQIGRLNIENAAVKKRLDDRTLGLSVGGGGVSDTMLHALMLDISRGMPLWDRPLGKILRVDPSNLMVYIDMGTLRGVSPELTFQVFAGSPQGRADRQLKGTLEVIRVIDENTSACRITSMFNDRGETVPLGTPEARMRALRDTESMFRDGDLLFNTFFDSHIAIGGNIGFNRVGTESPATQMMQLQEFTQLLRKQHIYVDAYVNLLNGQFEGTLTPQTRLLVRGDFSQLSSEDGNRVKTIKDAYAELEKQAITSGMFIISAENFASVIGYRPPQSQLAKESPVGFRPLLPFVNNSAAPRIQRAAPAAPMADPAPAAEKKE